MTRLLIVEDEVALGDALRDVIILGILLPKVNGFKVCSGIREAGNWTPILTLTRRVTHDGERVELTARKFALLEYLAQHVEQVVSKTDLLDELWDAACDGDPNIVEVHVGRLRRKIDCSAHKCAIEMVVSALALPWWRELPAFTMPSWRSLTTIPAPRLSPFFHAPIEALSKNN